MAVHPAVHALVLEQLARGERVRVRITTGSLMPLVRPGDWVWIEQAGPENFRLGDIALFRQGEVWMAHRLVGKSADGMWQSKGDSAPFVDQVMAPEWVGRAVLLETPKVIQLRRDPFSTWMARLSLQSATARLSGNLFQARACGWLVRQLGRLVRMWPQ